MEEKVNWFQSFFQDSTDAFLEYDQQQRYLSINKIAASWFGLDADLLIGSTHQELKKRYPENPAVQSMVRQIEPSLKRVLKTGVSQKFIHEIVTTEGIEIYETVYTPLTDSQSKIGRVFCIGRDITEYYTRQETLKNSQKLSHSLEDLQEEKQKLIALTADIGLALRYHPEDILIPCCQAIFHHSHAYFTQIWILNFENVLQLQTTEIKDILPPPLITEIAMGEGLIGSIAQTQKPQFQSQVTLSSLGLEKKGENLTNSRECKNLSLEFAGYPLRVENRLRGVVVILTEKRLSQYFLDNFLSVTEVIAVGIERKLAETELMSAKTFLNSILENLPIGVFTKDAESLRFILWNKAGEAITGITKQEILGKDEYDVFPKEQADFVTAKDREILEHYQDKSSLQETEQSIETPHKGLRILHTRKIPILDPRGIPKYLLGITEDITERKQIDASVRLYDQIVENMQMGLYVYHLQDVNDDETFIIISSNPAATRCTSLEMADVLGMTLDEIFPNQRSKGIPQAYASVVREQKAIELEDLDYDEIGRVTRAFSIKAFPLPNNCVGVAFEDITTRKQLEIELKEALQKTEHSEKLLRTVIDATPNLIIAKDRQFRYILANQSFANAIGKALPDIIGKDDLELGFSDWLILGNSQRNIPGFRADDQAVLGGKIIRNPRESFTFADRGQHIFDTQKIPLKDAEGEIFAVLSVFHDITERHKSEVIQTQLITSLQENEERYRSLVANIPGVVYRCLCDDNFTMIFMSDAITLLTGYSLNEFMEYKAGTFSNLILEDDLPQVKKAMRKAVNQQKFYTLEYRIKTADNSIKWVWEQGCPFYSEDSKILYLDGVIFDINNQKQFQEELTEKNAELEQALQQLRKTQTQLIQAEKMSSLGQLVAGIAHEINNPVNFITGNIDPASDYAQSLLELCTLYGRCYPDPHTDVQELIEEIDLEFVREDFPQLLSSIRMGASRIREIVQSLRNFSRLGEADLKPVDIHQGIDSTLLILHHRFKEASQMKSIQVVKNYGDLPLIECYPGLLNQAFMNILTNAIDALEETFISSTEDPLKRVQGNPKISISTEKIDENKVAITITDNGPGIEAEVKTHLFDPFFTTKSVGKGTGLGLSISYQIVVDKHHGSLKCYTELGKGSQFVIEIPVHQNEEFS